MNTTTTTTHNKYYKNNNNNNNNTQQPPKTRPNYFIGLRINNQEIQSNLEIIINKLKLKYDKCKKSFISKEKYHLTVLVMTLKEGENENDEEEELNKVKIIFSNIINQLYNEYYKSKELEIKLQITGLSTIEERVFYTGLKDDQDKTTCCNFILSIRDQFLLNSIKIDNEREWKPHITLAKGNSIKPLLKDPLIKHNLNKDFGTQQFLSIDLMKIGSTDNENGGYYKIIDSYKF